MSADSSMPSTDDRMRVLLVDDNEDTAAVLSILVESWGYHVKVAHTAAEAARIAVDYRPRVVLLDLGLPDEHGYELAIRMRLDAGKRSIAFVAITGWTQIADQLRSTAAGISHHLVKPINHDALRAILDGYRAAQDRYLASR